MRPGNWVELLFLASIIAFFIFVLSPPRKHRSRENIGGVTTDDGPIARIKLAVFWAVVAFFIVATLLGLS